jgi:hypothetical protein
MVAARGASSKAFGNVAHDSPNRMSGAREDDVVCDPITNAWPLARNHNRTPRCLALYARGVAANLGTSQ